MVPPPLLQPPLPLLVTGIAGVTGYNAFHFFHDRYPGQVVGVRQANNWPLTGPGIEACNAEDGKSLAALFRRFQFASVLNCAGSCKLKSCELDPPMAWRVNVEGASKLFEQIGIYQSRLIHLSIDLVYSGRGEGCYTESDPVDPITVYGRTMVIAESMVAREVPSACILRISLPMGISFNGHAGAIDWIQSRFAKNKMATLYYDEIRTPTYVDCLNEVFERVLASDITGLFHAGGPRRLSLFEIAQVVNRVGGYDPRYLMGCDREEAGPMPPRAGNVSLDSSLLAAALTCQPLGSWPLDDHFVPTHRRWHEERPSGEKGSPELLARLLYRRPAPSIVVAADFPSRPETDEIDRTEGR